MIGPRCPKVGNACLFALSAMPGTEAVAQLSRLKAKVKHASSRRMTDVALGAVASRTGLTNDELEEMSIPTYGLGEGGCLSRTFVGFKAELAITATSDA